MLTRNLWSKRRNTLRSYTNYLRNFKPRKKVARLVLDKTKGFRGATVEASLNSAKQLYKCPIPEYIQAVARLAPVATRDMTKVWLRPVDKVFRPKKWENC